jgi:hypothetical protein
MRAFLVTVLSVIAVGVLLIAYGLLTPRRAAADSYPYARPMLTSERVGYVDDGYDNPYSGSVRRPMPYAVDRVRAVPASTGRRAASSARRHRVERAPGRDSTKTAMVIGGSTAAGAGLGAIFGGKKGALIGAALGGGAGTLFEVRQR